MCAKEIHAASNPDLDNLCEGAEFEMARSNGWLYVDKTDHVYRMVTSSDRFIFCCRPRRFGKSLMCSTLEYLFRGRRDLFEGLYISSTDYDFKEYTVIHLDFCTLSIIDYEGFRKSFQNHLIRTMEPYGISLERDDPSRMLEQILSLSRTPLVLIVDEFDTPVFRLINTGHEQRMREDVMACLSRFFSTVNSNCDRFRFMFVTGILRLSNMPVFTVMDNLRDISMDADYATAFGYTQEELEEYFPYYIDRFMAIKDLPFSDRRMFLAVLNDFYSGYCFACGSHVPAVYCPWTVGRFFKSMCEFYPFWGLASKFYIVMDLAKKHDLMTPGLDNVDVAMEDFTSLKLEDVLEQDVVEKGRLLALLYYAGYLTIDSGNSQSLLLRFPNQEMAKLVSSSLWNILIPYEVVWSSLAMGIAKAVGAGDTNALIDHLKEAFGCIPPDYLENADEEQYKALLHMALKVSGLSDIRADEHGPIGNAENILFHARHTYSIEVRKAPASKQSLAWAMERGNQLVHYEEMAKSGRTVHVVGISFSKAERNIDSYSEVTALDATHFQLSGGEVVEHSPFASGM